LRVLLVEDNVADVYLFREAVRQHGIQTQLSVMGDGEAAILLLERIDRETLPCPDMIVVDLNLPKKSGLDVLKRIRLSPQCATVPVVVWSSSVMERPGAYRSGATAFIKKPLDLEEYASMSAELNRLMQPISE
jgi:chemotaxis family two-component system response regulator Rcp1